MNTIIVVEDDEALCRGICIALKSEGISFLPCGTLKKARDIFYQGGCGMVILDINLPDGNGMEFLKEIRAVSSVPVIVLTANDMETDIVAGLELGADDYVTKPFSLAVLRARVHTQLRRLKMEKQEARKKEIVRLGAFTFDFSEMKFYKHDAELELSKTEQKLLKILVSHPGVTIERAALVDRIWTDGAEYVDENALSVTVRRLRGKLEDDPSKPQYIRTVYGIGYVWNV
ncbi:MAG: response regulator transcription factor [Eubacterium sp.]|nr:response regulator transcription factor [Eubacterium sp.]